MNGRLSQPIAPRKLTRTILNSSRCCAISLSSRTRSCVANSALLYLLSWYRICLQESFGARPICIASIESLSLCLMAPSNSSLWISLKATRGSQMSTVSISMLIKTQCCQERDWLWPTRTIETTIIKVVTGARIKIKEEIILTRCNGYPNNRIKRSNKPLKSLLWWMLKKNWKKRLRRKRKKNRRRKNPRSLYATTKNGLRFYNWLRKRFLSSSRPLISLLL